MMYEIKQTLLDQYNRPRTPLTPQGIVVHETCGQSDSDENNYKYFNGANRSASAHYFVDEDSISQFIPDHEQAWHACYNGNIRYLGMELCHNDDPAKFEEIWKRGVYLVALKCVQYGWSPTNTGQVLTHHMVTDRWHESTHTDPDAYFTAHGKTFAMFVSDVQAAIKELHNPEPNSTIAEQGVVTVLVNNLNVRSQPSTTAAFSRAPLQKGETYKYYSVQNGWYCLGGAANKAMWVYGNQGAYLQAMPSPRVVVQAPAPKVAAPVAPTPAPTKQYNIVLANLRGFTLGNVHEYITDKGCGYTPTENKDGTITIEVGIFPDGSASLNAFEAFLTAEKYQYTVKQV